VLDLTIGRPGLAEPLSPSGDIGAQVLYAVRQETAMTLDDAVMRRTGIGQLGDPGDAALGKAADIMAAELKWDAARRARELEATARNFRTQADQP
jgi:glycerol-3-phosphate dehydrogenase